jgi:hypothetical protein
VLARLAHALAEPVLVLRQRSARAGEDAPADDMLVRVSAQLDDLLDGIVRLERSGDPILPAPSSSPSSWRAHGPAPASASPASPPRWPSPPGSASPWTARGASSCSASCS